MALECDRIIIGVCIQHTLSYTRGDQQILFLKFWRMFFFFQEKNYFDLRKIIFSVSVVRFLLRRA